MHVVLSPREAINEREYSALIYLSLYVFPMMWRETLADWGGKSVALTVAQVRLLLQVSLPRQHLDAETAIALLRYIQGQNYAAYCSHRKRTLDRLDSS